jgi:3-isopropylmalate/(R)-2-methylmalate dehydratase small subunit
MSGEVITGDVHRFGENVTTDDVIAGKYKHETTDLDRLAAHLMENIRPRFLSVVKAGDFIVAGSNFGCGSSREQAPALIKHVGIAAVVAPSFARIFYRNAINIGLLLLSCPTEGIEEGDMLTYEPAGHRIRVPERGIERTPAPMPEDVREIVQAGGLLEYVRTTGAL